jgi:hypothetical protein
MFCMFLLSIFGLLGFMHLMVHKTSFLGILGIGICSLLSACDSSKSNNKQQSSSDTQHSSSEIALQEATQAVPANDGKKLSEVAGQATLPAMAEVKGFSPQHQSLPSKAEAFVGRYHVQISCDDPFAKCDQGSAEFIINLLADGTAHRTFVYMGKISYENSDIKSNRSYQKNTWIYDEAQHEIIVNRIEGIQFFYKVDAQNNLIMDIDRILNGTEENRLYFSQHHTAPTKAYVLQRFDN